MPPKQQSYYQSKDAGGRGTKRGSRGRGGRGRAGTKQSSSSGATVIRGTAHLNRSSSGGGGGGGGPQDPPTLLDEDSKPSAAAEGDTSDISGEVEPHTYCLVCYDASLPRHRAILPCGHDDICATCHLRLRYLHSDTRCPVCKTSNEKIIVDADPEQEGREDGTEDGKEEDGDLDEATHTHKPFASYEMWGEELGGNYTYRPDVGMFFPATYHTTDILPIFSLGCQVPNCTFTDGSETYITESNYDSSKPNARQKREVKRQSGMQALNTHLRADHGLTLCNLCYMSKRDFVSLLPRFSPAQLKVHLTRGDGSGSGFRGHPLCEFCRPRRFYDLTKLHEHLNKEHYKCHICDKQGRPNQFFKNYNSLSRHFDREHFLCHHPLCLSARFVVFENEIALTSHERATHGTGSGGGSSKINLEFNVRGSRRGGADDANGDQEGPPREEDFQFGLDGEAFVPEALPNSQDGGQPQVPQPRQENEPDITHAAHAERTAELRAEAAQIREAQKQREQAEAFPSLGSDGTSAAATSGSIVGWTADGRAGLGRRGKGKLVQEEFPALSSGSKKPSIAARALRPSARSTGTSTGAVKWKSSTPAVSQPNALQSQAFFTPGPSAPLNRQSNLASDNFPSLGGGSVPSFAAANAYSRNAVQGGQKAPAPPTGADFPSLSATTPLSSQAASQKAAKERFLGAKKPPSQEALNNTLDFPPPRRDNPTFNDDVSSGKDVVRQMKAALGPTKYKELKRLTNYYAAGDMPPDAYVDMSSALFDRGAGDACFWKYMPGLIESCPNPKDNAEAKGYMENLRVASALQTQEDNVASRSATQAGVSGYSSQTYSGSGRSEGYTPRVVPSKKKAAWKESGGKATSVKQQESQQNQGGGGNGLSKKAKQKKKNDELKALAFGGK